MNNHSKKIILILLIVLTASFILTGCKPVQEYKLIQQNEFALGTFCQISIYHPSEDTGNKIIAKAFRKVHELENAMSTSIKGSDVYLINQNAGKTPVKVSSSTLEVIKTGIDYYHITDGAFNIGIGTLIRLWGIGGEGQKVPAREKIQQAKEHINIDQLKISNQSVFIKDPQMSIDLGGIAKGYAVDMVLEMLKNEGVEKGFINFGGDVYALGNKADNTPWNIGIQSPEIGVNEVVAKIPVVNRSIVTSGDYERYFIENGIRYHHIFNPDTGYPADNELTSVTILSNTSVEGDILSTAAFVMGLEEGLTFIENRDDTEGIFITKDKKIYATEGVRNQLEILDQSYKLMYKPQ